LAVFIIPYLVIYTLHKSALEEYQESGDLKKVIRNYSSSAGFDRIIEYDESDTPVVE
jgi:hypothetical protein